MNYFFPRLMKKFGFLSKFNLVQTISINGKKINIPIIKEIGFHNLFMSDLWMIQLIEKLLQIKDGVFIDVGANIGQTLIKLKSVSHAKEYIGFEPNPICVFYLRQLIEQNNFKNSIIIPVGIFNENCLIELNFFSKSEIDSSATLIKNFRPSQKIIYSENIPVFNFNSIVYNLNIKQISIIKIDVEGSELEVIESFYETILKLKPIILLEILPIYSKNNKFRKERQDKIIDIIYKLDYKILRVENENSIIKLKALETIEIHSDLDKCNYVIIPNELKKYILKE